MLLNNVNIEQGKPSANLNELLPLALNGASRRDLERLGFVFGAVVRRDYIRARLPERWTKRATSHRHWFQVFDERERLRADVFTHRDARMDVHPFVVVERRSPPDFNDDGEYYVVLAGGVEVYRTEVFHNLKARASALRVAHDEVARRYPRWNDVTAYWDEEGK